MSAPLVFAFCQEAERQTVRDACEEAGIAPPWFEKVPRPLGGTLRLVMLAFGPEGGAALARWVEAHGLDGVAGIGLVGVTAPWAERTTRTCPACDTLGAPCGSSIHYDDRRFLPLGPLEPLRGVAERAREGAPCGSCDGIGDVPAFSGEACQVCDPDGGNGTGGRGYPLRLVIASAPDDGVCRTCGGSGEERIEPPYVLEPEIRDCATCGGTCGALSSADVALELSGERSLYEGIDDFQATTGGLTVIHYPTRAELAEHGLAAVLKAVGS